MAIQIWKAVVKTEYNQMTYKVRGSQSNLLCNYDFFPWTRSFQGRYHSMEHKVSSIVSYHIPVVECAIKNQNLIRMYTYREQRQNILRVSSDKITLAKGRVIADIDPNMNCWHRDRYVIFP